MENSQHVTKIAWLRIIWMPHHTIFSCKKYVQCFYVDLMLTTNLMLHGLP